MPGLEVRSDALVIKSKAATEVAKRVEGFSRKSKLGVEIPKRSSHSPPRSG